MRTENGCKIGRSHQVYDRFCTLRSQGVQEIVSVWHRPDDAWLVEYMASRLTTYHFATRGHEWFGIPPEAMVRNVERAIEYIAAGRIYMPPSKRRKR